LASVPSVGTTWWDRIRRVNPLVWDSLLAALVASIVGAAVSSQDGIHGPVAWALVLAASAPLAVRRRAPLPVLAVVSGATLAFALVGNGGAGDTALALAIYTVAAHEPWRRVATFGIPVAFVGALASQLASQTHRNWVEVVVGLTVAIGLPIMIGRIVFNRRLRLVSDRESAAREAVALERTRIARELHDVVAHAMSVMIVQAGAARTVVDRDPTAAHDAIAQVEETGRAGLAEMRRLIGVLTDDGQAGSTAPIPGLAQLDPLLETVRSAGLPVELVLSGTARELPAGADLAAYRVIQESLTNALKHAGPASARVALDFAPDLVTIEVADDGRGPTAEPGIGHGLIGMRERVGMFGGTFRTSARSGGGFVVHAEIPVEEEA
jgi:signal transduction histidine kinase